MDLLPTANRYVLNLESQFPVARLVLPRAISRPALLRARLVAGPNAGLSPGRYLVILDGEPAASAFLRAQRSKNSDAASAVAAARQRAVAAAAEQELVARELKALGVRELGRFNKLVHAIHIEATTAQLAAIRSLAGVKRVEPVHLYEKDTSASVPFIGAPAVWGGTAAANGAGTRIAIIDTGIDYTHADFGGPGVLSAYSTNNHSVIEPGTFPTAKVIGGWDFAGDAYNEADGSNNVPQPDPDPLDCAGHGSHVAGIAAGFGVLTNGGTFAGPYTNGMDFSQFLIGPGVAPAAQLYALKVFGCAGSTGDAVLLQAVEWAADPNGDTNFSDHVDVINMSLGSAFGETGEGSALHDALNMISDLGCVCAISAGNSGETFFVVGSPGTAEKAISVACSTHNRTAFLGLNVVAPPSIAGSMVASEGAITAPLAQTGPIQRALVPTQPANSCAGLANQLNDYIAVIDRGTCDFQTKILNAQAAGAIAVVMVNNVAGDPTVMGGASAGITIPGVMVSQSDGALLKADVPQTVVRLAPDVIVSRPQQPDQIASFSSRGPAGHANLLKPEISAPGYFIASVRCGGGTLPAIMSGTSMSSPHVAGAAALLKQLHPDWRVEEIKAALMNTSRPTFDASGNPYTESRMGAGRMQVDDAARAVVTAKAENSGGLVTLSFGALELTQTYTNSRNIVLSNHGPETVTYNVAVSNTVTENGVVVTALANSVTIPGNSSAKVPVQLIANPLLFDRMTEPTTAANVGSNPRQVLYETSGQVWFLNTNLPIHVPYYANVRAASSFHVAQTNVSAIATNAEIVITLPMAGASAHPQPLLSAFQLGALSTNRLLGSPGEAVDLLAIGAASDASTQSQFANAFVYFGLATAGNWGSPQYPNSFNLEIDTNFDGTADMIVFNNSFPSPSDVIATFLYTNGPTTSVNSFINFYSASGRDTAPFNNSVIVMPMTVRALGLGVGRSQFRYRVRSYDAYSQIDQTDWITFDAAHPVFDTAAFGLGGRPFFTDGAGISLKADTTADLANGYTNLSHAGILLLHHFNTAGNRFEVVDVKFAPYLFPPTDQGNDFVLSWSSVSNATYTVQYSTNLAQGFTLTATSGVPATPPVNTFVDDKGTDSARFYRILRE
jgi:subtilisin family serine protease